MAQSAAELTPKDEDICNDSEETAFFSGSCCFCWNFSCFRSARSGNWERISATGGEQQESAVRSSWWVKGIDTLKKLREWSELVAGPKWKTFIRRFNKSAGKARPSRFQYDALSYSLNFDDGWGQNDQVEVDQVFRNFSSRYAAIPATNGQSKDAA